MGSALGSHRFAMAAVDAAGVLMAALSVTGSAYLVTGLARRVTTGLRWSAGRPGRRRLAAAAGLAVASGLAAFWAAQGQLAGW